MDTAIICVGNALIPGDDLGHRVYEFLAGQAIPGGVVVIDGGLKGIDLLPLVEGRKRVVFVDAVAGFGPPGEVVILDRETAASGAGPYDHGAGLPYLLRLLPFVCETPVPECLVVGAEGPAHPSVVRATATASLEVAIHGCS
ncbi:MAG: hydrogenase maturation protease [Rhodospirillales bacterium]|nr:hydrogenase maturation protease [Rhodospirillales bacterium]